MHKTAAGEQLKALKKQAQTLSRNAQAVLKAQTPAARKEGQRLQKKADQTLAEAKDLKQQARLEDLHVCKMEKVKESSRGSKKYTYWVASWRVDTEVRNVHLGSCKKLSRAEAIQKARKLKAEALGLRYSE